MDKPQKYPRRQVWVLALLLGVMVTGCSGDDDNGNGNNTNGSDPNPADVTPPENTDVSVTSVDPADDAVNVCPDTKIKVVFDLPSGLTMDPDTVNATTFSVVGPDAASVAAESVELDNDTQSVAFFTPQDLLVDGNIYTVTIMGGASGVKDTADPSNEMASNYTWTFAVGSATGNCVPVTLGQAAPLGMAATAGITNTPTTPLTHINGDVMLDPNATCNAIEVDNAGGFGSCDGSAPTMNGQVITNIFPDATTSGEIKDDMYEAYLRITPPAGPPAAGSLDGGTPIEDPTDLGAVEGSDLVVGQNVFYPGVYTSTTSIMISNTLRLDAQGNEDAVFIFQSASTIGAAAGSSDPGDQVRIYLINGTKASNVWWQAGSSVTLGTHAAFKGNVLAAFDITMETGATNCGRLLAGAWEGGEGALVLDSNFITVPGHSDGPETCL